MRIADDFSYIRKRMDEIAQDRGAAQFFLPEGIIIQFEDALKRQTECDMCFTIDSLRCRLIVSHLKKPRPEFLEYLLQCYPSAKIQNGTSVVFSPEDMKRLMARVRALQLVIH